MERQFQTKVRKKFLKMNRTENVKKRKTGNQERKNENKRKKRNSKNLQCILPSLGLNHGTILTKTIKSLEKIGGRHTGENS